MTDFRKQRIKCTMKKMSCKYVGKLPYWTSHLFRKNPARSWGPINTWENEGNLSALSSLIPISLFELKYLERPLLLLFKVLRISNVLLHLKAWVYIYTEWILCLLLILFSCSWTHSGKVYVWVFIICVWLLPCWI